MTTTPTWPSRPSGSYRADGDYVHKHTQPDYVLLDEEPAHALIGEMAGLLRNTRGNMLVGASVLGAITIGTALQAGIWAKVLRLEPGRRHQPGLDERVRLQLADSRAPAGLGGQAGAQRSRRTPLADRISAGPARPVADAAAAGSNSEEWTWTRAHLLVGAARLSRYRIQLADTWTFVTAAFFMACTAVFLLGR